MPQMTSLGPMFRLLAGQASYGEAGGKGIANGILTSNSQKNIVQSATE